MENDGRHASVAPFGNPQSAIRNPQFRAVFFDRDNTLIEDPGFISDPDQVVLRPGAAEAVRRVRAQGYKAFVVSNQSGVARGLFTEEQLGRVHDRLRDLLARDGAEVDGIYYCPYLDGPEAVVESYRRDSDLRKPKPGMLFRAAREWDLDLSASWIVGDRDSDVEAGAAAGCRTIRLGLDAAGDNGYIRADHSAATILEAARIVEEEPRKPEPTVTPASRQGDQPGHSLERPDSFDPVPETRNSKLETRQVLAEIRDAVLRLQRKESQEDFSFTRLIGSVMQMLAVVAAIWGISALFTDEKGLAAIPRLTLAVFLQLLTLTVCITGRKP